MKRVMTVLAAAVTSAALISTALPVTSATAERKTQREGSIQVTPRPAVLRAKNVINVNFRIRFHQLPEGSFVVLEAFGPNGDVNNCGGCRATDPQDPAVFLVNLKYERFREPGQWRVQTKFFNAETSQYEAGPTTTFGVKRRTMLSADAAPEPVRRNTGLTVSGRLTKMSKYGVPRDFVSFSNGRVAIEFLRRGSRNWVHMGFAKTDRNGKYARRFTARFDGQWRARFPGNAFYGDVESAGDYVHVR